MSFGLISKGAVRKIGIPFRSLVALCRSCSLLPSAEGVANCLSDSQTGVVLIRYRKLRFLISRRVLRLVAGTTSLPLKEVRLSCAQLLPFPPSPDPFSSIAEPSCSCSGSISFHCHLFDTSPNDDQNPCVSW